MPTRVAMVQGTPDQVQRATQMINEIVEQVCVFIAFLVTNLHKSEKKTIFFWCSFFTCTYGKYPEYKTIF